MAVAGLLHEGIRGSTAGGLGQGPTVMGQGMEEGLQAWQRAQRIVV